MKATHMPYTSYPQSIDDFPAPPRAEVELTSAERELRQRLPAVQRIVFDRFASAIGFHAALQTARGNPGPGQFPPISTARKTF
jgi:hypothetical protein